ncbi:MAG: ketoacyl-ACP synthase III [Spirochaetales bacterium]|nr:ketoacyl-ACP synthase III [Spirochaetales bacterium]
MISSKARITAFGAYVPERQLTNHDLEKMVDTSDEWIIQRTGIKKRHISAVKEFTSDLAVKAIENLSQSSGKIIKDVDYIIVATFTPDFYTPSCAALVQRALGLPKTVGVLDINAACAGFVQGLFIANSFVTSGLAKKILVIGAEVISKIVDYADRNTCVLFGDGAGAALVERDENEPGFLAGYYGSDGNGGEKLYCSGLATSINGTKFHKQKYIWQDGRSVYNFAIKTVPHGMRELLKNAELSIDDIDWFVPHSANMRMIQFICKELKFPFEKTLTSLVEFGNTSAATIPLAIWLAEKNNKIKKGDIFALYGFGGGFNHAGIIFRF